MPTAPLSHTQRIAIPKPPDDRPSAAKRGYGRTWQRFRTLMAGRKVPICGKCGDALESKRMHLDHIVARERGGEDTEENTQWLCNRCHSAKTAREDGGFGKPMRHGDA